MRISLKLVNLVTCFVGIFITVGCMPVQDPPLPSEPGNLGNQFNPVFNDSVCGAAAKHVWENEYQGRITATRAQYNFVSGRAQDCEQKIINYNFDISCGAIAEVKYANCHINASSEGRTDPRLDLTRANRCYADAKVSALSIPSPPCSITP